MSERLPQCPACRGFDVETVVVHDPDTREMNSHATLRCVGCRHEWEGLVTSAHHEDLRARGFVL